MSGQRKVLRFDKNNSLQETVIRNKSIKKKIVEDNKFKTVLSLASGLGLSIALPIAGGAFVGNILDSKFHSSPRITLTLIFFGVILTIVNIYTTLKKINEE